MCVCVCVCLITCGLHFAGTAVRFSVNEFVQKVVLDVTISSQPHSSPSFLLSRVFGQLQSSSKTVFPESEEACREYMTRIGATDSDTTRVCKRFLIIQKMISMVESTGKELLVDCQSYSTLDKTGFYSSIVAFHYAQQKLTAKVLVRDQLSQFTARKGNEVLCMELLLKGKARKHGLYSRHDLGLNKWGTGNGCKDTHEPVDPNPIKELEVKKKQKKKTYMHAYARIHTHTHTITHTYTRLHTCAYREATHAVKSVVT